MLIPDSFLKVIKININSTLGPFIPIPKILHYAISENLKYEVWLHNLKCSKILDKKAIKKAF